MRARVRQGPNKACSVFRNSFLLIERIDVVHSLGSKEREAEKHDDVSRARQGAIAEHSGKVQQHEKACLMDHQRVTGSNGGMTISLSESSASSWRGESQSSNKAQSCRSSSVQKNNLLVFCPLSVGTEHTGQAGLSQ